MCLFHFFMALITRPSKLRLSLLMTGSHSKSCIFLGYPRHRHETVEPPRHSDEVSFLFFWKMKFWEGRPLPGCYYRTELSPSAQLACPSWEHILSLNVCFLFLTISHTYITHSVILFSLSLTSSNISPFLLLGPYPMFKSFVFADFIFLCFVLLWYIFNFKHVRVVVIREKSVI